MLDAQVLSWCAWVLMMVAIVAMLLIRPQRTLGRNLRDVALTFGVFGVFAMQIFLGVPLTDAFFDAVFSILDPSLVR